jgi:hypothetical protein
MSGLYARSASWRLGEQVFIGVLILTLLSPLLLLGLLPLMQLLEEWLLDYRGDDRHSSAANPAARQPASRAQSHDRGRKDA